MMMIRMTVLACRSWSREAELSWRRIRLVIQRDIPFTGCPKPGLIVADGERRASHSQGLERAPPNVPMGVGQPERGTHNGDRGSSLDAFGALNVATGEALANCDQWHQTSNFVASFRGSDASVEPALEVCVVSDDRSLHRATFTHRWGHWQPPFHLTVTPICAAAQCARTKAGGAWRTSAQGTRCCFRAQAITSIHDGATVPSFRAVGSKFRSAEVGPCTSAALCPGHPAGPARARGREDDVTPCDVDRLRPPPRDPPKGPGSTAKQCAVRGVSDAQGYGKHTSHRAGRQTPRSSVYSKRLEVSITALRSRDGNSRPKTFCWSSFASDRPP